ncbi:hypothetical protein [Sodalis sp. (in: enterobacteria)]|uniref:hypothetical protein n=1 Tax=Sodalis sp. (in: enterobacteria) TaxID=1898979 RepID=UPI003F334C64
MVIAHADYPLDHYVFGQDIDGEAVLWSRKRIGRHQQGRGKAITGARHFFFGHTPVSRVRIIIISIILIPALSSAER